MRSWIFALSLIGLFASISVFAEDGIDRGNPGDEYSKEFVTLGYDLAENLAKDPIPGVEAKALLAAIRATSVHSEEKLALRGYEVDAINYPDAKNPRIVVSRKGWNRMGYETHRRAFLVLHEYLSIAGFDDSKYQISSLLDRAKVCERQLAVRQAIEKQLKKSCYRIIADDLLYVTALFLSDTRVETLKASDLAGMRDVSVLIMQRSGPTRIEPAFFQKLPNMVSLNLGAAITSLDDCSVFRHMPLIESLDLSDAKRNMLQDYSGFKPLNSIARGCFASLKNLRYSTIALDGRTSKVNGFMHGFQGKQLTLEGRYLDQIPVQEFQGLRLTYVMLLHIDRDWPRDWLTGFEAATGLICSAVSTVNEIPDGTRLYTRSCSKQLKP